MQRIQSQNEKMFEMIPMYLLFKLKFKFRAFRVWTNDIR